MQIIDRYILRSILVIFFCCIVIFSFLYILIDITSNLDEIIDQKIPLQILFQYYASFFPIIIVQTAGVACLIATLFTYSHLNNNNEIIVLRTSGLHFWQITKPALMFALVVSIFVFWLNELVIPGASVQSDRIRTENFILKVDKEKKKQATIKNLTFYGLKNRLYFIDSFDPNTYELEGITILTYDTDQNVVEKVLALKGKWSSIAWKFEQCHVTIFESTQFNAPVKVKIYPEKLMDIKETPQDFLKQKINVSSMNIRQLYDYICRFSHSGATKALNNLRVDLHQKIAFPYGNFVIILVGLPFALMMRRRKAVTFTSLGIAVAIGFLFYVCNAVGLALGKGGLFPPVLSAWLAPLIFTLIAFYLIKSKF